MSNDATILPDGSAFFTASMPLPKTHWLYAPRVYMPGHEEPVELPTPVLTHADRDRVVAAIRYAVRGATMCGKDPDFDPDALVQNAVYALCGPFVKASANPQSTDEIAQRLRINRNWTDDTAWASGVGVTAISVSAPFDGDPAYAMRWAVERVASKIEQQLLSSAPLTGAAGGTE